MSAAVGPTPWAVRGAIQLQANSSPVMRAGVVRLVREIMSVNGIDESDIISILFSQTDDLTAENPARCLRSNGFRYTPLFCAREPSYPDALAHVVRVLLTFRSRRVDPPHPIYLDGAEMLRADLSEAKWG